MGGPISDRIELRGLRVLASVGCLPGEQDAPQPLEVDADIEVDLSAAAASDDLSATVDYGAVVTSVASALASGRFALLETLAERVAAEVLGGHPLATAVTVAVRKLRPPVPVDLASAGVRITRRR